MHSKYHERDRYERSSLDSIKRYSEPESKIKRRAKAGVFRSESKKRLAKMNDIIQKLKEQRPNEGYFTNRRQSWNSRMREYDTLHMDKRTSFERSNQNQAIGQPSLQVTPTHLSHL